MPTMCDGGPAADGGHSLAVRLSKRRIVSALTVMPKERAKRAPATPLSASPSCHSTLRSRLLLMAQGYRRQTLGKGSTGTNCRVATKTSNFYGQRHTPSAAGQLFHLPPVTTMDDSAGSTANRTRSACLLAPQSNDEPSASKLPVLDEHARQCQSLGRK